MNFIIINPDQWRADYAGCYDHPGVRTPNLDRLAAQGTRFDQCHAQSTLCSPSRCSFMTGHYPHVRGHRNLTHLLRPHEPNLLKTLRRHGYEVAWFGKNDLLAQESFADSVDYYDQTTAFVGVNNAFASPDDPGYYSFLYQPMSGAIDEHFDARKVKAGIDFLKRPHPKPFCLYLPLTAPHPPFTCPQPYYDMYDPADTPPLRPARLEGKPALYRRIHEFYGLDRTAPEVFQKLNAVYRGTITLIDELIGRLLHCLDETGLSENTTVLVFSDHGEWAGDYGLVEKWSGALDDCLTRVPFVVRTPGGAKGHVVDEPVELFDQMATILDLAGLKADEPHFARSLTSQLQEAPGDPDRLVFAEGGVGLHEPHVGEAYQRRIEPESIYYSKIALEGQEPQVNTRAVMARSLTHKLVLRPETEEHEFYDLQQDPGETRNRYRDPALASVRSQLRDRITDWLITTADVTPYQRDPRGMPSRAVYWPRL